MSDTAPLDPGPELSAIADLRPRPVPAAQGLAPGTIADWLDWAAGSLSAESDSARADAEILLAALLGLARSTLKLHASDAIEAATVLAYASRIERRRLGEPVAYITARQGFWTLDLIVDTAVLIPRADTETLVEWALQIIDTALPRGLPGIAPRIADLGTGSGAIALALADARPDARLIATDLSAEALDVARQNAQAHGIANVEFRLGSWLQALRVKTGTDAPAERFHLIASNPPYIAEGDAHLAALRFEPRLALTSGADGLDALREIVREAPAQLHDQGWLLLEHGHDQAAAVRGLLDASGFVDVMTRRDFGGNDRVSGGRRP